MSVPLESTIDEIKSILATDVLGISDIEDVAKLRTSVILRNDKFGKLNGDRTWCSSAKCRNFSFFTFLLLSLEYINSITTKTLLTLALEHRVRSVDLDWRTEHV